MVLKSFDEIYFLSLIIFEFSFLSKIIFYKNNLSQYFYSNNTTLKPSMLDAMLCSSRKILSSFKISRDKTLKKHIKTQLLDLNTIKWRLGEVSHWVFEKGILRR